MFRPLRFQGIRSGAITVREPERLDRYETLTGCTLRKAFQTTGMKYVKLTVRDNDGDTNTNKQSFTVSS